MENTKSVKLSTTIWLLIIVSCIVGVLSLMAREYIEDTRAKLDSNITVPEKHLPKSIPPAQLDMVTESHWGLVNSLAGDDECLHVGWVAVEENKPKVLRVMTHMRRSPGSEPTTEEQDYTVIDGRYFRVIQIEDNTEIVEEKMPFILDGSILAHEGRLWRPMLEKKVKPEIKSLNHAALVGK